MRSKHTFVKKDITKQVGQWLTKMCCSSLVDRDEVRQETCHKETPIIWIGQPNCHTLSQLCGYHKPANLLRSLVIKLYFLDHL